MKFKCPSCSIESDVSLAAHIPDEQRMTLELTKEDGLLSASTLGGVIMDIEKALQATAKSIGERVSVFVSAMSVKPDGASVEFIVAKTTTQPKGKRK